MEIEGLGGFSSLAGIALILTSLWQAVFRDWTKPGTRYAKIYAIGMLLLAVGGAIVGATDTKAVGVLGGMVGFVLLFGIFPTIIVSPLIWWARYRGKLKQAQARQREEEERREREREAERASAVVLYLAEAHNCASPFEEIMQSAETHLKDGNPYSFWETMESVGNLMIFSPDDKMLGEMKHYDSLGGYEGLRDSMKGRMRELFVRAMNIKNFADMHYQRETIASLKEVVAQLQQLVSVSREALVNTANAAASTAQMVNCMKGIAGDIESIKKRTGLTVATTLVTAGIAGYIAHNQNSPAAIVGEIWSQP